MPWVLNYCTVLYIEDRGSMLLRMLSINITCSDIIQVIIRGLENREYECGEGLR
jgi:hypothetical protein